KTKYFSKVYLSCTKKEQIKLNFKYTLINSQMEVENNDECVFEFSDHYKILEMLPNLVKDFESSFKKRRVINVKFIDFDDFDVFDDIQMYLRGPNLSKDTFATLRFEKDFQIKGKFTIDLCKM